MSIQPPERVWWKPIDREEKIWLVLALIWMLVSFFVMPYWHAYGKQNPSSESYKVKIADFEAATKAFIEKYQVKDDKGAPKFLNGIPVVHPPANSDVYILGGGWKWEPVLELEKNQTYRVHLSSNDLQHGFSIYPLNINYMVIPGQDYVLTIKPTTAGEFSVICNEYCGQGHHAMVGRIIVK